MAIEMAHDEVKLFVATDFFVWLIVVKYHNHSHYKLTMSYTIVHYYVIIKFVYFGNLQMGMDAVVATDVDGGWAIVDINMPVEIN